MNALDKDPEVLATFKEEAYDRLAELEHGLDLLQHGQNHDPAAVVHELFRSAHSLKATANLLHFGAIEAAAKALEDVLHALRRSGRPPAPGELQHLVELLDRVGLSIDEI